jgi:hypothetical protein
LRKQYPALRRGRQVLRAQSREPGLFAVSRIGNDGREILLAFNTSPRRIVARVQVEAGTRALTTLLGHCEGTDVPGSAQVELLPFGYSVCLGGAAP